MMKQVISLSKYMKVLVPSMAMCSLILGTFIYPLSAYADNTVTITVNGSDTTTYLKAIGITDDTQGKVISCSIDYWGGNSTHGYSFSVDVNRGDRITVGIFSPPTNISGLPSSTLGGPPLDSVCTKKKNRLAVLYHGRIKGNISV